jgi:erythromycin esterase
MDGDELTDAIRREAHALRIADPDAPVDDLEPLRAMAGAPVIAGLGVPTHGTHELSVLAHRLLRVLVEQAGFRTLALEESSTVGAQLDRYVRTGEGDVLAIMDGLWPHHRTAEVLHMLEWMRARSEAHPEDPMRCIGLEPAGEAPVGDDRIAWVEPRLAGRALQWHEDTGTAIVHWGGCTHTAVGDARTVTVGPATSATHRNAGSHLRAQLGPRYLSVGLTFHHGGVEIGSSMYGIPPPPASLVESVLGDPAEPYLLDLRSGTPGPVREWLDAPAELRLVGPRFDPANPDIARMSGGSLADWFDALVHVGTVHPAHHLRSDGDGHAPQT